MNHALVKDDHMGRAVCRVIFTASGSGVHRLDMICLVGSVSIRFYKLSCKIELRMCQETDAKRTWTSEEEGKSEGLILAHRIYM